MDSGIECSLIKFADSTKLWGAVNMLEGRKTILRDLERLERVVIHCSKFPEVVLGARALAVFKTRLVSHLYGFGLMDAEAMVIEAEKWTTVPPQHVCVENTDRQIKTIRPDSIVRSIYKATGCSDNPNHHVIYLEHVVVRITITHPRRGDLAIYLTSPSGTRSQLLANRLFDHSMEGFKNWEFMTTHSWSEKAAGDWILEICDTPSQLRNFKTPGKLKEWSLVLYGTSIQPYSPRNDFPKAERVRSSPVEDPTEDYATDDYSGPCNAECSKVGCDGPGPDHCTDCLHYYYKSKNNTRICVSTCPPGHYNADKKRCKKCSPNCETCVGGHNDQCMTCKSGYYLNEVTNSCITNCPDGFYLDKDKIVCRKCSENCKTCIEFQICTECRHGLSLHGNKCAIHCDEGKYHNGKECETCHHSCAACAGAGVDACINCTLGYFMEDGRCVQSCSSGYYLDHSTESGYKSCKRCDASCLDCSGQGDRNCTSCPSGYNLDTGVCVMGTVCKDVMPSKKMKAVAPVTNRGVSIQTESSKKDAATQAYGCIDCLSLEVLPEDSVRSTCIQCEQVNNLLCLVAELKEEVERLRSISESERQIDWWSHTLSTPKEAQQEVVKPSPSCHQADRTDHMDGEEWKQVPGRRGKKTPSQTLSPAKVPLKTRYMALDSQSLMEDSQEEDLSTRSSVTPSLPDGLQLQI
ncbi:hypothetical protein WISP_87324 [Willisornis vidua]|uniref:P/Homo B domain-containing protein n=1 Tax=Willisornis vidua TaxID=1566151 RepID=A0ABQ9D8N2_9PASS|nr:hypothetical protein WISP_87324 [Willisornis vidua]